MIPGAEEVLALLELRAARALGRVGRDRRRLRADRRDAAAARAARGARLVHGAGLPRRAAGRQGARPVLTRAAGVPMPEDAVFDAVERLHGELDEVRALLTGPDASVRLVLTPETVVLAEARRSLTTLSLFGYRVDGVVANRVFPADGADDWRAGWVDGAGRRCSPRSSSRSPGCRSGARSYRPAEPVGVDALRRARRRRCTAATTRSRRPTGDGPVHASRRTRVGRGAAARAAVRRRADVDLARHGDELVVTVGSYRRLLTLPAGLARHRVAGARVEDGRAAGAVRGERRDATSGREPGRRRPTSPSGSVGRGGRQAARRAAGLGARARRRVVGAAACRTRRPGGRRGPRGQRAHRDRRRRVHLLPGLPGDPAVRQTSPEVTRPTSPSAASR